MNKWDRLFKKYPLQLPAHAGEDPEEIIEAEVQDVKNLEYFKPWIGLVFVCAMILLVVCVVVVLPLGSFWTLITTPTADRSQFMLWMMR